MERNNMLGAWMGAAIGDAMGGPVEGQHYANIVKKAGYVDRLLPYTREWSIMDLHPGYALHGEPGSITDDTYIRADIARYFLSQAQPWTVETLCSYLLANADFAYWWKPAVEALQKVEKGASPTDVGKSHKQGGGNGWWYPVAMLYEGQPEKAAEVVRELSLPWKSGLETDLLGALVGAMAYALQPDSDYRGAITTAIELCDGSLASGLLERAVEVGESAATWQELCDIAYKRLLIHEEPPREIDAPLPAEVPGIDFTEKGYAKVWFAEQMPLMFAGFAFGKGTPDSICATVTMGRDCDSTATAVGFLVGALVGLEGLPDQWVDEVQKSNLSELDLMKVGNDLCDLAERIAP